MLDLCSYSTYTLHIRAHHRYLNLYYTLTITQPHAIDSIAIYDIPLHSIALHSIPSSTLHYA